jgi:nitrite reductase/ring-hydroxylating ferredoxin subunit/DMSO/TMAO reductase YedYZ heme-binding membrane subunit
MSVQYVAIGWNRQKRIYDSVLAGGMVLYLAIFTSVGAMLYPAATAETLLIRAFGTLALLMLHVILCIGPLCRLDSRFLPLLYNRRHLGVAMFLMALVHGVFSIIQFHALGNVSPVLSLLTGNPRFDSLSQFPFELLGLGALLILFLMAATSHDFWLHNLSAPVWKSIHMLVYAAYALLVGHVLLGAIQAQGNAVLAVFLGAGVSMVSTLHLTAAWKERRVDRMKARSAEEGFVEVCEIDNIPEKRARVVAVNGERIAVFRYDGKVSAVSNVCRHQNGPLGEGRIIDGCITCPWHGYQYTPENGASPPPFTDKVPTFQTRIVGNIVLVHPIAHSPGTRLEPSIITPQPACVGRRL